MSEKNRKTFTGQFKAKVALEAIRGAKTLNEIAQGFYCRVNGLLEQTVRSGLVSTILIVERPVRTGWCRPVHGVCSGTCCGAGRIYIIAVSGDRLRIYSAPVLR